MNKKNKLRILTFTTTVFFTLACLSQVLTRNVYANANFQEILITEVMPMSQTSNDAYEYIELYNNSDRNIDLKDYKLPLQNIDITTSKVIAPKGILVVCTKSSTTLDNFNAFYGTALTADKYVTLPFINEVLSNNSTTNIIISKDDDTIIVKAQYYTSDFQAKRAVTYKYSETGVDMIRLGQNQSPTPGSVSIDQLPQSSIRVTGITLDKSLITIDINQTTVINATIAPATATNKSIVWASSNSNIAQVSQNGIVTAKSEGAAIVTASTVDGGLVAVCTVVVRKVPVTGITLDKSLITIDVNQTTAINATVAPATATNKSIVWASSNSNIAQVSQNGIVTAKAEGAAIVTATTVDAGMIAVCTVVVRKVPVTGITLDKSLITIDVNQTTAINATVAPATATNKSIVWASSNSNIAQITQKGIVTAKAEGAAIVTATTVDGRLVAVCTVVVRKVPVTGVILDKTSSSIEKGKSIALKASITPTNATNKLVTWESSNSSIASVDSKGVVVGKSAGEVRITVTTKEGNFKAICVITVKDSKNTNNGIFSLRLNKTSIQIKEGKFEQLNPIITPGNLKKIDLIWKSSNEKIATVNKEGRVFGKTKGNVVITVTTKDGKFVAKCTVKIISK